MAPSIGGHSPVYTSIALADLAWSPDARFLYFLERDGNDQRAVRVRVLNRGDGRTTTIASGIAGFNGAVQALEVVPETGQLMFAITEDRWCMPATLYRMAATGGRMDTLASDVEGAAFATSPDGVRAAFVAVAYPAGHELCPERQDSLVVVHAPQAGTFSRRALERGISWMQARALSVSRGGGVVYLMSTWGSDPSTVVRYAPADGAPSRDVARVAQGGIFPSEWASPDVVWSGESPRLVIASRDAAGAPGITVTEVDGTGVRSPIGHIADGLFLSGPVRRSADGARWVAWAAVEDLTPDAIERHAYRYALFTGTRAGGEARQLLELSSGEPPWKLAASPDGKWAAFYKGNGVYVVAAE